MAGVQSSLEHLKALEIWLQVFAMLLLVATGLLRFSKKTWDDVRRRPTGIGWITIAVLLSTAFVSFQAWRVSSQIGELKAEQAASDANAQVTEQKRLADEQRSLRVASDANALSSDARAKQAEKMLKDLQGKMENTLERQEQQLSELKLLKVTARESVLSRLKVTDIELSFQPSREFETHLGRLLRERFDPQNIKDPPYLYSIDLTADTESMTFGLPRSSEPKSDFLKTIAANVPCGETTLEVFGPTTRILKPTSSLTGSNRTKTKENIELYRFQSYKDEMEMHFRPITQRSRASQPDPQQRDGNQKQEGLLPELTAEVFDGATVYIKLAGCAERCKTESCESPIEPPTDLKPGGVRFRVTGDGFEAGYLYTYGFGNGNWETVRSDDGYGLELKWNDMLLLLDDSRLEKATTVANPN